MQTPITITIESARFFETTLGVFRNALLYLLLLTMECRERERDKAGADMGSRFFETKLGVVSFTFTSHGLRERMTDRKRPGKK